MVMLRSRRKTGMPAADEAPSGRTQPMQISAVHHVTGATIVPPFPDESESAYFALGCFWGAERVFWQTPGVVATAVGYQGGHTPNPTYEEVCSGRTGHAEAVQVVYDPAQVSYEELLAVFWESHDPTQGMRQGNDIGTQYRSAIYHTAEAQQKSARASRDAYQQKLTDAGYGQITTEIGPAGPFYYAEEHHQQYLAKNPSGYCGTGGTGISCPTGIVPK